jgi:hypothetical protein
LLVRIADPAHLERVIRIRQRTVLKHQRKGPAVCGEMPPVSCRGFRKGTGAFDAFIRCLTPALVALGFVRRSQSFVRETPDTLLFLGVQRSVQSTADAVRVTPNLGVFSHVIAARMDRDRSLPVVDDCHRNERIGHLAPAHEDLWWTMSDPAEARGAGGVQCGVECGDVLRVAECDMGDLDSVLLPPGDERRSR